MATLLSFNQFIARSINVSLAWLVLLPIACSGADSNDQDVVTQSQGWTIGDGIQRNPSTNAGNGVPSTDTGKTATG